MRRRTLSYGGSVGLPAAALSRCNASAANWLPRKVYGEIQDFFRELEKSADLGVPMHGEWEGCRRAHVCDDRYRVIWRDLPETEDYAGDADDTVVPVEVLRVGPKMLPDGETIYQQPNPADK